jgi:sarcosine oxidase subunit alpha
MHHRHVAAGALMEEIDGWLRPARYASVEEELGGLRQGVGLCDVSPTGKLLLQGEAVDDILGAAFPALGTLDIGGVRAHSLKIGSTDRHVVPARLAADEVLVLTPPNMAASVAELLVPRPEQCGHAVDITSALAGVQVTGPLAHPLLRAVTEVDTSPAGFPDMTCVQAPVAEVHGTLLRRDAAGLLSFELFYGREYGEYVWDALMEAGEEYGVSPFGVESLNSLD